MQSCFIWRSSEKTGCLIKHEKSVEDFRNKSQSVKSAIDMSNVCEDGIQFSVEEMSAVALSESLDGKDDSLYEDYVEGSFDLWSMW